MRYIVRFVVGEASNRSGARGDERLRLLLWQHMQRGLVMWVDLLLLLLLTRRGGRSCGSCCRLILLYVLGLRNVGLKSHKKESNISR